MFQLFVVDTNGDQDVLYYLGNHKITQNKHISCYNRYFISFLHNLELDSNYDSSYEVVKLQLNLGINVVTRDLVI